MVDEELVARQKLAAFSLISQGLIFSVFGFISAYVILHFGPIEITGILAMFAIFAGPAIIPLTLGSRLYRGKFTKWTYEGWAGVSLCLGVLFVITLAFRRPVISPFYIDFLGIVHIAVALTFLMTPWAILRLTHLYGVPR